MRTSWKKSHEGESFDRFSNIPDGVVHEILCFLSMKDIARTNLVSKRFRLLCLSVPDLFLDFKSHPQWRVGNWTDRFLTMRDGAKLRRFVLKANALRCQDEINRVLNCIHNAAAICKAEVLNLSFSFSWWEKKEFFFLPPYTFMRVIKLRHIKLKLPSFSTSSTSFSCLQFLDIRRTTLDPHNLSENWVSSLFPAIKVLHLQNVRGINHLNITSSSLEWLCISTYCHDSFVVSAERLHTICVETYYIFHTQVDWFFRIYAPSLQKISWSEKHYCSKGIYYTNPMPLYTAANKNLLMPLQFINHAKSVTLIAGFVVIGQLINNYQDLFTQEVLNVQNLELLHVCCKMDHKMPALASLFGLLPNLKTLTMRCTDCLFSSDRARILFPLETHKFDIEYWEGHHVAFIHQLKEVKIEIQRWGFEVGLIKYLIKHAKAMDRMTVTFARDITIRRSRQISDNLSEFYETFSDATLDFVLK